MTPGRIDGRVVSDYKVFLHEPSRPPGRGGNTTALHRHVLTIDGNDYGFFARGAQKWAFKHDLVSFAFESEEKNGKTYFNIETASFSAVDGKGHPVIRGNRTL